VPWKPTARHSQGCRRSSGVLALLAEQPQRSDAERAAFISLISERAPVITGDRPLKGVTPLVKAYGVFSRQYTRNTGCYKALNHLKRVL